MVSSFLGNTGRVACLPGVAENEENDEDFANGDGFEAKSRRNPLWIPRIFNAESGRVCRNILRQYRIILSADTASEVRQMPSQKRR